MLHICSPTGLENIHISDMAEKNYATVRQIRDPYGIFQMFTAPEVKNSEGAYPCMLQHFNDQTS